MKRRGVGFSSMLRKFWNDDQGAVLCIEFVLCVSIMAVGCIVGTKAMCDALENELNDISHAVGAVDQTYKVTGVSKTKATGVHATCSPFGYDDAGDDCDCMPLTDLEVCGKSDPSTGAASEGNL